MLPQENDLQQVTKMSYAMVTVYGMSEKVGNVSFYDPAQETPYLRDFMCLFKPGDIVKWKPIDRAEYDSDLSEAWAMLKVTQSAFENFPMGKQLREILGVLSDAY